MIGLAKRLQSMLFGVSMLTSGVASANVLDQMDYWEGVTVYPITAYRHVKSHDPLTALAVKFPAELVTQRYGQAFVAHVTLNGQAQTFSIDPLGLGDNQFILLNGRDCRDDDRCISAPELFRNAICSNAYGTVTWAEGQCVWDISVTLRELGSEGSELVGPVEMTLGDLDD